MSIDVNGCTAIDPKDYYKLVGRRKQVMTPKLHAAMKAMEAESEGKIHISPDLRVYQNGKYPEVLEKCELVGKGPSFSRCMQEMLFTILVARFMSILGWPLTLRLAKQIYGLRH